MRKKVLSIMLSCVMAVSVFAGCSTYTTDEDTTSSSEEAKAAELTIGVSTDVTSLDTSVINDNNSGEVLYHTSEGLLRNVNGKIENGIAESYEISDDNLVYTFHLREANWEDGEPITAQQFVYSFQRFFDPNTGATEYDKFLSIVNAQEIVDGQITDLDQLGVKAEDDHTLVITLKQISPTFISSLAASNNLYPLREDFVTECGTAYGTTAENYLSCGPYKIEAWNQGADLIYVKNDQYYNADSIKMDKITRVVIEDANTRASMFDNGEIDVNMSVLASLKDNYDENTLFHNTAGTTTTLQINTKGMTEETGKVLSNVNFIKALSYAIDRQGLNDALANGTYEIATRIIDPATPGSTDDITYGEEYPDISGAPETVDAEKANEYLDKALEELGMTKDQLPEMTYLCMETGQLKLYAEAIIDSWKTVLGLDCFKIVQYPVPTTIQNMLQGQYDIYWQQCGADVNDPYMYMSYWTKTGSINVTGWMDDTYSDYIAQTEMTMDRAERLDLFSQAEQYLLDNGPQIPLFFFTNLITVNPEYTGISYSSSAEYIYADFAQ